MQRIEEQKQTAHFSGSTGRLLHIALTVLAIIVAIGFAAKYRLTQEPPRHPPAAWFPAAPSPIARAEGPGAVVGEKLYVAAGFSSRNLDVTKRLYAYDHRTDTWERLADMPIGNTHIVSAVDGDTIWYAGGYIGAHPGEAISDVYKYHVPSNRWSEGPALPEKRAGGVLVKLGRNLHYISGLSLDRNTNYDDHWVLPLDGPQTWSRRAPLPIARSHMSAAVLDGRIYVIGGQLRHDSNRKDLDVVHGYDPQSDTWTEMPSLPFAVSHTELSTLVWNKQIYVFGGRSDSKVGRLERLINPQPWRRSSALPDVFSFDPATGRWEAQLELPVGLLAPVVVNIGDKIIITNGSTFNTYFPQSNTFVGCFPLRFQPTTVKEMGC